LTACLSPPSLDWLVCPSAAACELSDLDAEGWVTIDNKSQCVVIITQPEPTPATKDNVSDNNLNNNDKFLIFNLNGEYIRIY
jgi:hypothetical protein